MRVFTAARALVLTALTIPLGVVGAGSLRAPLSAQQDGRALAAELGCGGCHTGMPSPEVARGRAPRLGPDGDPLPVDFVFSYLADPERRRADIGRTRMPDFRLDEGERVALSSLLGSGAPGAELAAARARHPDADAEAGRLIFRALGCASCHAGVAEAVSPGVGPDLSREGVRVRADWLRGFLAEPTRIRADGHPTAPGARMPDFRLTPGEVDALAGLLDDSGARFAATDDLIPTRFETARTERLLRDRFACLGCHRVEGAGGGIGPSLDGIAERLQPGFVLEAILDPARAMPGSAMPRQPMPEREARRIARYLLTRPVIRDAAPDRLSLTDARHPARLEQAASADAPGAALYARHCAACHGASGEGDGWNAPALPVPPTAHADAGAMTQRPDDALYDAIHGGAWVLDGSARMPPFGQLLDAEEIRSLVATIRRLCDCEGPPWSADGRRREP